MPYRPDSPRLTFAPQAWLQWQYFCHAGPTEIGTFGYSREHQPLYVENLIVVKQRTSSVSVAFDAAAVANLFDEMADEGIPASRFARIWLHTHPGASVTPSGVDEETFVRVFGRNDWAVMGILGRTGKTSARLRFNAGPGSSIEIPTAIDWSTWPAWADSFDLPLAVESWREDYDRLIEPVSMMDLLPDITRDKQSPTPVPAGFNAWLFEDDPFFNSRLLHEQR